MLYHPTHEQRDVGRRLLPTTIDEIARENPKKVWASIPNSSCFSDGYRDISFRTFANAINRMAWYVESKIGRSKSFETYCYIGVPDMRYAIMSMAAAKTGHKALYSSHMHSLEGHLHLLTQCECNILMTSKSIKAEDILEAHPVTHFIVPELAELLDDSPVPDYPFTKTFEEAVNDPYLILHTSGSTGLPKPVTIRHAYYVAEDMHDQIPITPENKEFAPLSHKTFLSKGKPFRNCVSFVPFHVIGSVAMVAASVFANMVYVYGQQGQVNTAESILEIIQYANLDTAYLSPTVLEEYAKSPEALERLAMLKGIFYAGGSLSPSAGGLISQKTRLIDMWGSTETNSMIQYETAPSDWQWIHFDFDLNGMSLRPIDDDDKDTKTDTELFELVLHRHTTLEKLRYQSIFNNYPDLQEWPIRDIYSKHPTNPHLIKYQGRIDDLVCFADGNKFHPLGHESLFSTHPLIKSVLVYGTNHQQALLLIELKNPKEANHSKLLEEIWPMVEEANARAPANAQLARSHVLFAKAEKPFFRAGKGTVQRRRTLEAYEAEIDEVYREKGDVAFKFASRY